MIDAKEIAAALKQPCMISSRMQTALDRWEHAYRNESEWQKKRVRSLRIPSAVCKELKRLTTKELQASVNDAELDAAVQKFLPVLRRKLDYGLAMGGMLFKPYWTGQGLQIDLVAQNEYLPLHFTDDICTAVACPETVTIGKTSYTRIEMHSYDASNRTHTIENRCFQSNSPDFLGKECSLSEVPAWSALLASKVYPNVPRPLFAVFRMPDSNSVDPDSPLGISAFADSLDDIRDADCHWERILWELESSERAIDATEDMFRLKDGKPVLPKGRERMFRTFNHNPNGSGSSGIFETVSPEIRDTSYFNALNEMLRRVENGCGLSYGTLSRVDTVEKTAEEVLSSKQRSYDRVNDIQNALGTTLRDTVTVLGYFRDYYENRQSSNVELTLTFGDGVLEDADKEFARRMQMVTAGLLSKEQFNMWYFSCDEKKAREYLPQTEGLFPDGNPVI